jgi:hypothetical protein
VNSNASSITKQSSKKVANYNINEDFSKLDVKSTSKSNNVSKKPVDKKEDDLWEMLNN